MQSPYRLLSFAIFTFCANQTSSPTVRFLRQDRKKDRNIPLQRRSWTAYSLHYSFYETPQCSVVLRTFIINVIGLEHVFAKPWLAKLYLFASVDLRFRELPVNILDLLITMKNTGYLACLWFACLSLSMPQIDAVQWAFAVNTRAVA